MMMHGIRIAANPMLLEISNTCRMVMIDKDCVLLIVQSTILDGEVFYAC